MYSLKHFGGSIEVKGKENRPAQPNKSTWGRLRKPQSKQSIDNIAIVQEKIKAPRDPNLFLTVAHCRFCVQESGSRHDGTMD